MKILHYSDETVSNFLELYLQADVMVTTGDLSSSDFAGLDTLTIQKPSFGVYGNHDSGNYMESLNIINLHNKVYEYKGLKWGGWQGCLKYKNSPLMYDENQAAEWANVFPRVDILLLHAGPWGMLDDPTDAVHIGSPSVARYVQEKKPKFVFVGHQYSNEEMESGLTKLYRTYGARLIEI